MARSKLKKKKSVKVVDAQPVDANEIPIKNLPDKYLWMKVKSGTKIRNVLEYALKEFTSYNAVVWSGNGQAVGKVISCAEIFKRKIPNLHQITKLRYVPSKKSEEKPKDENSSRDRVIPEIHLLLSKNVLDAQEPGYQAPGVSSMFQDSKVSEKSVENDEKQGPEKARISEVAAMEFASMGLRTSQKRRQQNQSQTPTKKSKNLIPDNE